MKSQAFLTRLLSVLVDLVDVSDLMPKEFVSFEVNVPKTLKVTQAKRDFKLITDPDTKQQKQIPALVLAVCSEDGKGCDKPLFIIQKRLIAQLAPLVESGELFKRPVRITKLGAGFTGAQWQVELLPS